MKPVALSAARYDLDTVLQLGKKITGAPWEQVLLFARISMSSPAE